MGAAITVPPKAAIVVPDPVTPQSGDVVVRNALVAAGYDVTYVDDNTIDVPQASAYDVVWIGGNTDANAVLDRLEDAPVPIVDQKSRLLGMMSLATKTSTLVGSTMTILTPGHPLAAGRSGTITVMTEAKALTVAEPTAAAVRIADPASAAYFALPTGAAVNRRHADAGLPGVVPGGIQRDGEAHDRRHRAR